MEKLKGRALEKKGAEKVEGKYSQAVLRPEQPSVVSLARLLQLTGNTELQGKADGE
jgi:hypothetical protein